MNHIHYILTYTCLSVSIYCYCSDKLYFLCDKIPSVLEKEDVLCFQSVHSYSCSLYSSFSSKEFSLVASNKD